MNSLPAFDQILNRAAHFHGGMTQLEASLPQPRTSLELESESNDRYLSMMTRCVFRSGFVWRVVDAKWPAFEEAFAGFQPELLAMMPELEYTQHMENTELIRHRKKLLAIRHNAAMVSELVAEYGSFGGFLAAWPEKDVIGLWQFLKKHGARLGGVTGPYFLRSMGKDTFLLTRDVVAVLVQLGLCAKAPTSQRDLGRVQQAFLEWHHQTGRPFCQLSKVLACSLEPALS